MRVLGVIPARDQSKRIPRKNLAALAGKPLLAHTCEAARASRVLTRVVLSTDDPWIAEVGRAYGVETPFLRPAALAGDDTPMIDVLQHAVCAIEAQGAAPVDVVVLLQPTSPLRRAEHIDAVVELLAQTGAGSVVTVVEVPHQFNPRSVMRLDGERLVPFNDGPTIVRRQDKPLAYARNGPAVLAVRRAVLMDGSLYGDDCRPFVMSAEDSIDVDTPWDLALAELALARRASSAPAGHARGGRR